VRAVRVPSIVTTLVVLAPTAGCRHGDHGRLASFTRPPLPAGFVEAGGTGWKVAVPSTWGPSARARPGTWVYDDPQAVDDYRANVSVITEPFAGESYDYAKATEDALHRDHRATVEASREDVIDGDPTFVIESRWAPSTPAAGVAFRTMQADLASRGTGYVVTCAASASAFERYRSTCEAIVRSFAVER
jgi:hypothetical protein